LLWLTRLTTESTNLRFSAIPSILPERHLNVER
jgi:hypothetical protein